MAYVLRITKILQKRFQLAVYFTIITALLLIQLEQARSEVISQKLKDSVAKKTLVNILVTFKNRPGETVARIATQVRSTQDRSKKLTLLSDELENAAVQNQGSVMKLLQGEQSNLKYRSLWITNQIAVRGASMELINKIASVQEVLNITEAVQFTMRSINGSSTPESLPESSTPELKSPNWGTDYIQTDEVWKMGYDGSGIVVGIIDTGVMVGHDSLRENYVGTQNYGWFDPDQNRKYPVDVEVGGHGTSCLGVAVGSFGFGVAPAANWMACLVSDNKGIWHEDWIIECIQFMLCPTDYKGSNKNCAKAPHVINNSWYYPPGEDDTIIREITPILVMSNIMFIFCIGNVGPGCGTASPPGSYPEFIGVGATVYDNQTAKYSSNGPGYNGVIKPDLVAGGDYVYTPASVMEIHYLAAIGTSFSAPAVVGVIALMLQKNPTLTNEEVKQILLNTTTTDIEAYSTEGCGGISTDTFPNNQIGYGMVNALKAINRVPAL